MDSDSGAQIRDGVKSVASEGDCPEDLWPYDINKFADKPSQNCYDNAVQHKAVQYQRVVRDFESDEGMSCIWLSIYFWLQSKHRIKFTIWIP